MKKILVNLLLIVMPVAAVALAATVDSVTVYDASKGITETYSYFSLIPCGTMQILPPTAALLCAAAVVLAVAAVAWNKAGCIRWLKWIAFTAAVAAVAPILLRSEQLLIVPNALLPIMMMGEYFLAHMKLKARFAPEKENSVPAGPRLD